MQHISEVAHIVKAALDQDRDKVRAYTELLIAKLGEDGEDRQAHILNCILYPSLEDIAQRVMPGNRGDIATGQLRYPLY